MWTNLLLLYCGNYTSGMHNLTNILFDLDGTLIEPEEGIINSVLYALEKMGIAEENQEVLTSFIGPPLIDSFSSIYHLEPGRAKLAVKYYREFFADKGIYQNSLYPGITDLLKYLKKEGFMIFLATSKPTVYARKIINHHKLGKYFSAITGSNLDHSMDNKRDIIGNLVESEGLSSGESVMIGDRIFDIEGARYHGMKTVFVTYGYGSKKEILEAEADFVADSIEDIRLIITRNFVLK